MYEGVQKRRKMTETIRYILIRSKCRGRGIVALKRHTIEYKKREEAV